MNAEANLEGLKGDAREDLGYTLSLPSGPIRVKLPYVIGVLADLCPSPVNGKRLLDYEYACDSWAVFSEHTLPKPHYRRFYNVTDSSFQTFMAFMAPELKFSVPNILTGAGEIGVHLSFRSLQELTPESIAAQVPELSGSGMASSRDPGLTSRAVRNQLALILEHEALVGLTRTWCGIHSLAREIQPGSNVQLRVMHISRREILKDLEMAAGFDQSSLFKKLYDREYGRFGGKPYDCIIADFDFDHTPRDVTLLSKLSDIAAAGHFVILASAAPAILQLKDWEDLNPDFNAHLQMAANSYIGFRSLRENWNSRYLFLTLPAGGSDDDPPDDSQSALGMADKRVETANSPITLSPSYLVAASIAKCFRETGWFVPQSETFPSGIGEPEQKSEKRSECGHGEAFAGESLSAKLSDLGLNRIQGAVQGRTLPTAVRSLCRPPAQDVFQAGEREGMFSLVYMSCANHIIHYAHSIVRDRCSFSGKSSDYFDVIMEWLNGLSSRAKDGTNLFAVTARALSEIDDYMSNSQDAARIDLEFIRGFEPPGPKLHLLRFSTDEAPFLVVDVVVGVLMDLSRFSEQRLEADRKFVAVDADNLDHVIRGKKCRLSFKVRNLLNGQGNLAVDLQVETLDDLNPRQVAKQVIPLARLLEDRRSLVALAAFTDVHRDRIATLERISGVPDGAAALRSKIAALTQDLHLESPPTERSAFDIRLQAWITDLANESDWDELMMGLDVLERWQVRQPGQCVGDGIQGLRRLIDRIDGLIDRQLDPILHHRDFQQFESTWRGLRHLVTSFLGDRRVRIRCIDASKEELFLEQADPALDKPLVRDNSIYSKLAMEKEWEFGESYNIVIADYRFTGSSEDLAVLGYLQKMAAKIDAVMYAPVEPDMLGFQSWEKLDAATVGNLAWPAGIAERLERVPHKRHLVLCAPEILGRPAYTRSPEGIGDFQYAESCEKTDSCLWCRPAFWAAEADIRQRLSENEAEPQVNSTTNGMNAALMEERPAIVPKYAWDAFVREALRRLGVEAPPFERDPSVARSFQEG